MPSQFQTTNELERVLPVIERLAASLTIPISIDTRKAAVAQAAIEAGAEIINDVSGLEGDPAMIGVAVATGAGVCVMHMQGTPQTMQDNPTYGDVVAEVRDYLRGRRDALIAAGIDRQRICLDPGIGFGKTHEHNLTLLRHCRTLHELGCPLLVGHRGKDSWASCSATTGRSDGGHDWGRTRLGGAGRADPASPRRAASP